MLKHISKAQRFNRYEINVTLKFCFVFFKTGNQFWAVRGNEVQAGYPRDIQTLGFPPTVRKIDAAIFDKNKNKTYFFVEDKYWR